MVQKGWFKKKAICRGWGLYNSNNGDNIYVLFSLLVPVWVPVMIADRLQLAKRISNDNVLSMYTRQLILFSMYTGLVELEN